MRYAPVGQCIYCGTREGKLTDEHIIPYGLGGDRVLPKASCGDCARRTSQTELTVLRSQLFEVRAKLGLPSRKSSLPDQLPLTLISGEEGRTIHLAKTTHPTLAVFLLYPLPGSLGGNAPVRGIHVNGTQLHQVGGPPLKDVAEAAGATSISFAMDFEGNEFEKMLAKVAYSFAVAEVGIRRLTGSPLPATILGRDDDCGRWVGCGMFDPPAGTALHEVGLRLVNGWLTAHIRLFSRLRTPEYVVVVVPGPNDMIPGVAHGASDDVLQFEKPGITIRTSLARKPRKKTVRRSDPSVYKVPR